MMTKLNNWQSIICYEDLDENDGRGNGSGCGGINGVTVATNHNDPEYSDGRTYGCGWKVCSRSFHTQKHSWSEQEAWIHGQITATF